MSDPTKVSRRLVAVFAADVEGYSRLMGADEVGTLKGLTERRAILDGECDDVPVDAFYFEGSLAEIRGRANAH